MHPVKKGDITPLSIAMIFSSPNLDRFIIYLPVREDPALNWK